MDMLGLGALAIIAALCTVVIKQKTPEIGMILALATCVILLWKTMPALEEVRNMMDSMAETAGISDTILTPVLKTVGLAIVTRLSAELCRDAKENGIAVFIEIAGAAAAVLVAIPLLRMVLQLITGLL